jgi:regulatory protein YycI of two-component signal transduction system YycFG
MFTFLYLILNVSKLKLTLFDKKVCNVSKNYINSTLNEIIKFEPTEASNWCLYSSNKSINKVISDGKCPVPLVRS